jgi:hypothetical protein
MARLSTLYLTVHLEGKPGWTQEIEADFDPASLAMPLAKGSELNLDRVAAVVTSVTHDFPSEEGDNAVVRVQAAATPHLWTISEVLMALGFLTNLTNVRVDEEILHCTYKPCPVWRCPHSKGGRR